MKSLSLVNPAVLSLLSLLGVRRASTAGQFGHDEHLDRLAEWDGALDGALGLREALRAFGPHGLRAGQLAGA